VVRLPTIAVVLIHTPEGAVNRGSDIRGSVVAPPRVGGSLHACTIDDGGFSESHLTCGISLQPPGVTDSGKDIHPIDYAEAEGHVALPVHGDTAHPAVHAVVQSISTLLEAGVLAV